MQELNKKAFGGLLFLLVVLATSLFLPAWTFNYWQGWIFLGVFSLSVLAITLYLMKKDPELLARRVDGGPGAEKERRQQFIQSLAGTAFIGIFVLSAIDHRFAWSSVPIYMTITGDVLVALGLLVVFSVFKENSFTSATIEVGVGQKVVSTGPYALIRHPMYVGAIIMLFGVPVSLGSWWGLLTVVPIVGAIVWRLLDEERFLAKNLPGYVEYQGKVRYRLLPFVW